jgi:hypothetical protein
MTQDHNVNMPNRRAFFFPSPCYGGERVGERSETG